jgi:FkbM family methyltransferase
MPSPNRPIAYVLAATNHGNMIVNRNDHSGSGDQAFGVGYQLLSQSCFDPSEIALALDLLSMRRKVHGDGVVAIDGGANVGVHTIEWARHMHGWGRVLSFEAQEFVFYALAGNIALNNCFNASARWSALGEQPGTIKVPEPDYLRPGSFGSLEIRQKPRTEFIGQQVSYDEEDCITTPMQSIDALALDRLDFVKLDIEGMEMEVLRGARKTLEKHKPVMIIEVLKSDRNALADYLGGMGYNIRSLGINLLAMHNDDPTRNEIRFLDDDEVPPG